MDNGFIEGGSVNSPNVQVSGVAELGQVNFTGTINATGAVLYASGAFHTENLSQFFESALSREGDLKLDGVGGLFLHGGGTVINASSVAPATLENQSSIAGAGHIGAGTNLAILNDAGGSIVSNVVGQTIYLDGMGGITNAGKIQAGGGDLIIFTTTSSTAGRSRPASAAL